MPKAICFLVLALGFGLVGFTTTRLDEAARENFQLVTAPPLANLPPPLLKVVTLGHKGLYDDFANIWALQFLSDPRLKDEDPQVVFQTLQEIAAHEIKIESFYMLSCFVMALELNQPQYCEPITLAGTKAMPESWRIPFTQGFIFTSLLGEPLKAAAFLKIASSRPGAPSHIGKRVDRLMAGKNLSRKQMLQVLETLIPADSKMGALLLEKNLQTRPHADSQRRRQP